MESKTLDPSQNARKHGLTGQLLILSAAEQEQFDELSAFLREDFKPQNQFEEGCFSRILHSQWRLDLSQNAENRALHDFLIDPDDAALQKRYERFAKYRRHYERCLKVALSDLRQSQENRFIQQNVKLPENTILAPMMPVRSILRDFKKIQNELPRAVSLGLIAETMFDEKKYDQIHRAAEYRRREENRRTASACLPPVKGIDPTRANSSKTRAA